MPNLTQCIEREREAWERMASAHDLDRARAATDEAVRAVEGRIAELEARSAPSKAPAESPEERCEVLVMGLQCLWKRGHRGNHIGRCNGCGATASDGTPAVHPKGCSRFTPVPTAQGESTGGEGDE